MHCRPLATAPRPERFEESWHPGDGPTRAAPTSATLRLAVRFCPPAPGGGRYFFAGDIFLLCVVFARFLLLFCNGQYLDLG